MAELKLKDYVIGTLTIALLISLGIIVQPDDTHFCRSLELAMKCDRLSSTEKTCYPTAGTTKGSKYCAEGWEEIVKVGKTDVVVIDYPSHIGCAFECSVSGCIQIR